MFRSVQPTLFSFAETVNTQQGKQTHCRALNKEKHSLVILLLLLAGDIQMNPSPGNRSDFPCGTFDIPVTLSQEGVCCNKRVFAVTTTVFGTTSLVKIYPREICPISAAVVLYGTSANVTV